MGPTVLDRAAPRHGVRDGRALRPGARRSLRVDSLDEALALERATPYGNATSIFTSSGAAARYVAERATSGMIGVNVGVPVPRDPVLVRRARKDSRFGQGDITGPGALELWSQLKKITTRWAPSPDASWMS